MKVSIAVALVNRMRKISAVLVLPTTSQMTFGGAPSSRLKLRKSSSFVVMMNPF
jgi:hypothetical protein